MSKTNANPWQIISAVLAAIASLLSSLRQSHDAASAAAHNAASNAAHSALSDDARSAISDADPGSSSAPDSASAVE